MIKHVNYQIRNIPFLVSETENVVPDAPLTNYPGEDFFDPTSGREPTSCSRTEEEELRQSCELRGNEAIDLQFRRQNYCFFGT